MLKPNLNLPKKKHIEDHILESLASALAGTVGGLFAGMLYMGIIGPDAPNKELVFFGPMIFAPLAMWLGYKFKYHMDCLELKQKYKRDMVVYNNHVQTERLESQRYDSNRWAKEIKANRGRYEI